MSEKGITPMKDKVAAIQKFREPVNLEETRSFLGLINYVGKFIPDLALVTETLRKITRMGTRTQ